MNCFLYHDKANYIVQRQLNEITTLFNQKGFKQHINIGGDEVVGAIGHQKDYIQFLNKHITYLHKKNYHTRMWNDMLTNMYLNDFQYKPTILYWKNTNLTQAQFKTNGFNVIDVNFDKNAVTLPTLNTNNSLNEELAYLNNQNDSYFSAFVIWGENNQQLNHTQLENTVIKLIKSYLNR